ncbi:unnamed protein product [Mytilus coruscus]|uniref:C-type lectin domain-containing protein n=1 Tax=Mytilus coruscus TaxID=42192 RepID=A0A6J8EWU4_MYTCO|nr:unnamed protein product [Mytilus coruscus]
MGFVWKWKDDSEYDEYGTIQWAVQPYNPALCIGIGHSTGLLYDQICSFHQGVLCQKDVGNTDQKQPDRREKNYICAYVYRGELYDDDCSSLNNVICQVNATEQLSTLFGISSDTLSKSFLDTSTTDASLTSSKLSLVPGGTSISEEMSTLRKTYTNRPSSVVETTTVAKLTQHRVTYTNQCKCLWNYTDQSDNKQTYLPYKVDKKSLSSYRGRRQCARDYRKSALYLGCGGITVLVLVPIFIVILDFLPSA